MSKAMKDALEAWDNYKHEDFVGGTLRHAHALAEAIREALSASPPATGGWRDGVPTNPWATEWFIAETTYGGKIVLKALPEGWSYDFRTADETYIKADKIKRWMQFPDSQYIAPPREPVAVALKELYDWYDRDGSVGGASEVFENHRKALYAAPQAPATDAVEALKAENERLKEALTPSGDTKAEYSGEFYVSTSYWDDEADETREREVMIDWTTIKEIMKAITARALRSRAIQSKGEA